MSDTDDKTQGDTGTVLKVPVECYSRIVGYLRPLDAWNKGKQQEFHDRKVYKLPGGADAD